MQIKQIRQDRLYRGSIPRLAFTQKFEWEQEQQNHRKNRNRLIAREREESELVKFHKL